MEPFGASGKTGYRKQQEGYCRHQRQKDPGKAGDYRNPAAAEQDPAQEGVLYVAVSGFRNLIRELVPGLLFRVYGFQRWGEGIILCGVA